MFRRIPVHVLLLTIYPSVALPSQNIREVEPSVVLRPAVTSLLLVTAVYLGFWLFLRDSFRAALSATVFTLLFFSYGHVYQALEPLTLLGVSPGRHRYLLPVYLCLSCAGLW